MLANLELLAYLEVVVVVVEAASGESWVGLEREVLLAARALGPEEEGAPEASLVAMVDCSNCAMCAFRRRPCAIQRGKATYRHDACDWMEMDAANRHRSRIP